ncbi:MAG TPA: YfiR family protein [Terriglobales bacterium]
MLGAAAMPATAQAVSDYQVKAAYLFNFAKFIEWPAQAFANPTQAIHFCVWDDPLFESELQRIVSGKSIGRHVAVVERVRDADSARHCHLLFIPATTGRQTRHVLDNLRGSSVLTAGESERFLRDGGMINFMLENQRVRFEINHKATAAAGLTVSARLLSLARGVSE